MNDQAFYLVWSPQGHSSPKFRHPDFTSANEEAKRLARSSPNCEFYVLEAKKCVVSTTVKETVLKPVSNDIPF